MTAENPDWRQQCLPGRDPAASACSRTASKMAYERYPVEHRSNRPNMCLTEQPASRTRFYRDKRNGK